jgi:hypothetical protein
MANYLAAQSCCPSAIALCNLSSPLPRGSPHRYLNHFVVCCLHVDSPLPRGSLHIYLPDSRLHSHQRLQQAYNHFVVCCFILSPGVGGRLSPM